jgi:hypothetical protein
VGLIQDISVVEPRGVAVVAAVLRGRSRGTLPGAIEGDRSDELMTGNPWLGTLRGIIDVE